MNRFQLGDASIASIIERDGPVRTADAMFPRATAERIDRALSKVPNFTFDAQTKKLNITYQTLVVRMPNCTALIDTCVGDHPNYPDWLNYDKSPWLAGLKANGLVVEDIDYVFCTHMHIDHVGWNTRTIDGRHVPTFPNAKYIFSRKEYEHWKTHEAPSVGPSFEACVNPIVEAGQALLVEDSHVLSNELSLIPSAGHSAGHVCVSLRSRGRHALFTGDLMHHAIQCVEPDWSTMFCLDADQAARTRRGVFERYADTDTLFVPTHFPAPTAGRVRRDGDSWRFDFLESA